MRNVAQGTSEVRRSTAQMAAPYGETDWTMGIIRNNSVLWGLIV
jgi:hypothetical protein